MKRYRYETDEHVLFRETLRKFLSKEAVPYYDQWEKDRLIPVSFWRKLGEMGFLCPQVEEQYGGLGLDFSYGVIIGEEMERVGAGLTGVGLHNDIVVPYIESYGTDEQKKRWLPGCITADIHYSGRHDRARNRFRSRQYPDDRHQGRRSLCREWAKDIHYKWSEWESVSCCRKDRSAGRTETSGNQSTHD